MEDPVKTKDKHSYDRAQLEQWLKIKSTSPLNPALDIKDSLVPDTRLRKRIEKFVSEKEALAADNNASSMGLY